MILLTSEVLELKANPNRKARGPVSYTHLFAVLLPGKKIPSYTLIYWDGDGNQMEHYDPYAYPMQFTEQEQKQFENGICYSIYEKLGAHPVKIDGVSRCV